MLRVARALMYAATAGIVLGLGKFHASAIGLYDFTDSFRFNWSLAYIGLLCIAAYGVGLPDRARDAFEALWLSTIAAGLATVALAVGQTMVGNPVLPRFVLVWSSLSVVPVWTLACFVAVRGGRRQRQRDRVLAVLDDDDGTFAADLALVPERRAALVGVIDVRSAADRASRVLFTAVEADDATLIVIDRAAQADADIVAQVAEAHASGVRVRTLSLFYEQWLGKLPVAELEQVSLLFDIGEIHRSRYVGAKRLVDIVVSLVGLVGFVVIVPLVVLGNLIANRGPLIYRQERVGKDGRPFTIVKFRTMRPGDRILHDEWTTEDDPRITPFGRLLRLTHIDELPQTINVLAGDLAVVGPRPEQTAYVEELSEKIPFYPLRHLVRPGITGWAQVKYGYAGNESDALEKLQYDFFYLRHQSIVLDLRIMGRSLREILGLRGR